MGRKPYAEKYPHMNPNRAPSTGVCLQMSEFQKKVMLIPETYDLFLGGGRGGAKSYTLAILALRHAEQYGQRARILYLRKTYRGCADFESMCLDLYGQVYGRAAKYNSVERVWRFPSGATLEIGQLESAGDYQKFQGRSFTLILIDESGQYSDPSTLDRLRSNMRGSVDIPIRMVLAANPADAGHYWLATRFVFRHESWKPFYEEASKRHFVSCPSTYLDNIFLDQAQYKAQLESSCAADSELLKSWLSGDWHIARGAYFGRAGRK